MTKEEFVDWKNHPITERFFEVLASERTELMEAVGHGETLGEHIAQATAGRVGQIRTLSQILSVSFDDLYSNEATTSD